MQATPNPYAEFLKTWGGLAGVVSLLVSVVVLLRSLYLDRPHLWFIHKKDETEQSFVRTVAPATPNLAIGTATLIVSNNSSRPNAILEWNANMRDTQGNGHPVDMLQGTLTGLPPHNVTPIVLPAFNSAEAHLLFLVDVSTLPNPAIFDVKAKDRTGKVYQVSISIPNVVRNTFS
jgi:hypothetical protein